MTRVQLAVHVAVATLVLAIALAFRPISAGGAVAIYVLFVGALFSIALLRAVGSERSSRRSPFDDALRRRGDGTAAPPQLHRAEREVRSAIERADGFESRLAPSLREVASRRLLSRHGVSFGDDPRAARAILGERLFDALSREPAPVPDRQRPGISPAALRLLLDDLERI